MDRRFFVNISSLLAATGIVGCGGGDSPENTATYLEEFDSTGPIITPEDRTAAQVKGSVPIRLVPQPGLYDVEITYLTTKSVEVKLTHSNSNFRPVIIGAKSATTGTNNALGFAKFFGTMSQWDLVYTRCLVRIGDGARSAYFGSTSFSPFVDYKNVDSEGRKCSQWIIYDPELPLDKTSIAAIIRFYEAPSDGKSYGMFTLGRLIPNNVKHVTGGGHAMTMPHAVATTIRAPQHQSLVIRSASDNRDTLMIPSDPTDRPNHYAMVPHIMGASAELKPHLARYLARHSERLGAHSASVHGVLDNNVADTDQFNMAANEKLRLLGGQGVVDHLNMLKTRLGEAIQKHPPIPAVSDKFDSVTQSVLAMYPAAFEQALQNALSSVPKSTEFENYEKSALMGAGLSFGATAQVAASYKSTIPSVIFGIPVSGAGVRVSLPLGSYGWLGDFSNVSSYRIGHNGQVKLAIVLIIKMFDLKNFVIDGVAFDIEITLNLTLKKGHAPRVDSVNIEFVLDTDSKTWMGWIIRKSVEAFSRRPVAMPANTVTNVLAAGNTTSTAGNLEMTARTVSQASMPPPAGSPTTLPTPVSQFDTSNSLREVSALKKEVGLNSWSLLEGYLRFAFVNTSIASGTYRSGWHGLTFGVDFGLRGLAAVGLKGTVTGPSGTLTCFARLQVASDYHYYAGPQSYVDSTKYIPNVV